jgi:hypothetical protein
MSTQTARDRFKKNLEDGGDQVIVEYFKRLGNEAEASIDDLRKAVELVAKAHGLNQSDKVDSMMQVSWTINGGNVTIGVTNPSAAPEATEVIEDATIKEVTGSPDEPPAPTTPALVIPPLENLLDQA